jgi:hypothetical protein
MKRVGQAHPASLPDATADPHARTASDTSGTILAVDTGRLTLAAALMAAMAIAALVATGWRPRAKVTADPGRSRWPELEDARAVAVEELHAPTEQRTNWLKRLWSVVATTGLAVWVGAALATVAGFAAAWLVIHLTDMLRR